MCYRPKGKKYILDCMQGCDKHNNQLLHVIVFMPYIVNVFRKLCRMRGIAAKEMYRQIFNCHKQLSTGRLVDDES